MTFLSLKLHYLKRKAALALVALAGVLMFAGGAAAAITGVTISSPGTTATLGKGSQTTFAGAATGDGGEATTVSWSLTGSTNAGTAIDPSTGVLVIAPDEAAASISVVAASTVTTSEKATCVVTITGSATVTNVNVTSMNASVNKGGATEQFSAAVTGTGNPWAGVTWSVTGPSDAAVTAGTSISTAGVLTVAAGETNTSLIVKATSKVTTTVSGTKTVTVATAPIVVTVSPATATTNKGAEEQFQATVTGGSNPAQTVTWSIVETGLATGTSISQDGKLIIALGETVTPITVKATSTVDNTKFGTAVVTPGSAISAVAVSITSPAAAPTVAKGGTETFVASVAGTGGTASQALRWTIDGTVASGTTVTNGVLVVAKTETATTFKVVATSVVDGSKKAEMVVTVSGEATVSTVTVTPTNASIDRTTNTLTQQFQAAVAGDFNPMQTVTWSLEGQQSSGTTISSTTGLLTVAAGEKSNTLTVKATSVLDNTKFGTVTVALTGTPVPSVDVIADRTGAKTATISWASDVTGTAKFVFIDVSKNALSVTNKSDIAGITASSEANGIYYYGTKTVSTVGEQDDFTITLPSWVDDNMAFNVYVLVGGASGTMGMTDLGSYTFVPPTGGDGNIYKPAAGLASLTTQPIGNIILVGGSVSYEPGTSALKVGAPEIVIQDASKVWKKSDFIVKTVVYSPDGTSGEGPSVGGYDGSSFKDKGVRDLASPDADGNLKRKLVAGKYTVVASVALKSKPTLVVGESKPVTFEVMSKNLSKSMVTVELTEAQKVYNNAPKDPRITVKDGSTFLQRFYEGAGVFYDWDVTNSGDFEANIPVGTYDVVVEGNGNYKGRIVGSYTITKRELSFDQFGQYTFKKEYDGTLSVSAEDSGMFTPAFMGYPTDAPELGAEDYIIKDGTLKYTNKDAGTGKTIVATIDLSGSDNASNYKLKSNSFSYSGGVIVKGTPTADLIKATFDNPARTFSPDSVNQTLYNKSAKEVKVQWASGVSNSGSKFTVKYNGETVKPIEEGSYAVTVDVTAGSNLEKAEAIDLGSLNIVTALNPIIAEGSPADTFYYAKSSVTLRVAASNPKDGKTSGLTYQWYQVADTGLVLLKGKTSNNLVVNDTTPEVKSFQVQVTYKGAEQVAASIMSRTVQVTTLPAPVSLRGAIITANNQYEYDGSAKKLTEADLSVTVGSETLEPNTHYVIQSIRNNVNAGDAVVTIKGVGAYKETESGSFAIAKKPVELSDLQIIYGVDYNGTAQEIRVGTVSGKSGLGEVTRIYDNDSARVNAGSWNVELIIAEGANFEGSESIQLTQAYVIRKARIDESIMEFSGVPKEIAWNGQSQAIAKPTLKGVGTFYTGTLDVKYLLNGEEVAAVVDSGLYTVQVAISGDRNFANDLITLGTIEIHGKEWTGVKDAVREIPGKKTTEQVAIAPVKVVAGEVTVGPNPVANGSSLNIFWNGSKAVSGKLAVYTSVGKKVAVVPVSGSKKIGTWNTSGAPEGTYLIKGVLNTKDGTKVKVSNLVSVTR